MLPFCPFGCTAAHVKQAARIVLEAAIFWPAFEPTGQKSAKPS